ncbi:MAG: Argininosuccinate lyase [Acetothermia bacterium 64_32]|nr:MAG: Argininosuccinate lyase [Acetothermia bacterium 64_32]HAF69992.1 argininosuccinate lyase [Candidatus Acetothermia bacterium]
MTLWAGRLTETDAKVRLFCDSFPFDRRLYAADIQGSIAYARALERAGVLSRKERVAIQRGLERILVEFKLGQFVVAPGDEDIHTAVERRLTELVGEEVAGKLHTGRSRNDQVATDLRLWLLSELPGIEAGLVGLEQALVGKAEGHLGLLMPGYTHLRQAQPLLFSHWLLSHFWRLERDRARLGDLKGRAAVLPLGAGAIGGNPWLSDREDLARELGFERAAENSLDAVSDRDFVAELLFFAALCGVHLSQLAEDLILFSSPEFGFLKLDERFLTGSSLMPQKANPDPLELVRGRAGRLIGELCGFLSTLKGLPSGYNRDLQEDKEPLFLAVGTLKGALPLLSGLVEALEPEPRRMREALEEGALATELADYLVGKGVPFRAAHRAAAGAVKRALELGVGLSALPLEEYRRIHPAFGEDLYGWLDFERAVGRRASPGGTAPQRVRQQIELAKKTLKEVEDGNLS